MASKMQVTVGKVRIGGGAPVSVQSMTNTDTADREATIAQIRALAASGADIVRVSVYNEACADAVRDLVDASPVPLVADIHFDYRLAVRSVESGIHKLRINPGNIGGEKNVRILAGCLKAHHIPMRIGVNSGSVEKDILDKYGAPTPEGMVESALRHAAMLEKCGFTDIVLSMKASTVRDTVAAYRLASRACPYPLHLGVTEAGLPEEGRMKSAIGIGTLLMEGIGDTLRVSLTGDPCLEPPAGIEILRFCGYRNDAVQFVSCPTCGRTCIDVAGIMRRVQEELKAVRAPFRVAVMGCVVNGPGEAREADIGICGGGNGAGLLIRKGREPRKVEGDLAEILMREIRAMLRERGIDPQ
ncbi:MAG: flavodoxin-dependent (E)-4-hydroxy-3-methylbut-2-enyl-diphosphate synthase [Clostridiales bacterium]|nr:flavodoxin-dependent (E)-4-hydroxy-3-methylbut-2-enyl-diphosphate synthase [Clostridiales bacterium]